ncbi:hypothetical protein B0H67DRAFT_558449 [Lasiosphaeris hirsuta]|uniref:Uncharacterized protein n=1 Tax=Lasiosphaeris hirsuta TaxID=260670 RepID=A0AA39ZSH1_9PEZI|nr:hypothetical protein B0H67DRAFT_558449 [Lasiosphaeris hirsuta]
MPSPDRDKARHDGTLLPIKAEAEVIYDWRLGYEPKNVPDANMTLICEPDFVETVPADHSDNWYTVKDKDPDVSYTDRVMRAKISTIQSSTKALEVTVLKLARDYDAPIVNIFMEYESRKWREVHRQELDKNIGDQDEDITIGQQSLEAAAAQTSTAPNDRAATEDVTISETDHSYRQSCFGSRQYSTTLLRMGYRRRNLINSAETFRGQTVFHSRSQFIETFVRQQLFRHTLLRDTKEGPKTLVKLETDRDFPHPYDELKLESEDRSQGRSHPDSEPASRSSLAAVDENRASISTCEHASDIVHQIDALTQERLKDRITMMLPAYKLRELKGEDLDLDDPVHKCLYQMVQITKADNFKSSCRAGREV